MKNYFWVIFLLFGLWACQKPSEEEDHLYSPSSLRQFERVLSDTNVFPPVINPHYVELHRDKMLILDLRSKDEFEHGHIEYARYIQQSDLVNYLNFVVHPSSYEDIVLVSQCGQGAVFSATLLQLLGYKNVFALRYGMAGWNKSFSFYYQPIKYDGLENYWESGKQHSVKTYEVDTSKFVSVDWEKRVSLLLRHSVKDFLVRADTILESGQKITILDYRPSDVYEMIHLKGAVNFDASEPFDNGKLLSLIPQTDDPVVIYSCHPYNAISLMAYLRLLGYNAYALSYGFHELLHSKIGKPFDPQKDFLELPVVIDAK